MITVEDYKRIPSEEVKLVAMMAAQIYNRNSARSAMEAVDTAFAIYDGVIEVSNKLLIERCKSDRDFRRER